MGSFLGWILESSLLVLMILGIRRLFMGRVRYAGIYALWLVVLLRFLIPVNVISTPLSVGDMVSHKVSAWKPIQLYRKDTGNNGVLKQEAQKKWDMENLESTDIQAGESGNQDRIMAVENNVSFSQKAAMAQSSSVIKQIVGLDWQRIFGTCWVVISSCLFLWLILSNICLMCKFKKDRTYFASKNGINIYGVSGLKTPCLYGFFRPAIYVPRKLIEGEAALETDSGELEQIITHEYVHYRHKDHIWSMLRMLLVSAYWFHPFMWLAVSCSKKDAELFCDETVIGILGEEKRFSYGEMLVRLAGESRWGDFRYSLMPMSKEGKEMERRIRAISVRRRYSSWTLLPLVFMVSAAVGITCSAGVNPLREGKAAQKEEERKRKETSENRGEGENMTGGVEELLLNYSGYLPQEYQEWLRKTRQISEEGNSDSSSQKGETERIGASSTGANQDGSTEASVKKEEADVEVYDETIFSSDGREAFCHYIEIFTEAVNTGNTDKMHLVLDENSEVYEQQCALVKNYYKRGIREEIKGYTISSVTDASALQVEVLSNEKIKVFYKNGTSKLVKQKYRYICENVNGNWLIKGMMEVEG